MMPKSQRVLPQLWLERRRANVVPKEGMRIEVRAETFNALNHARFAPPNTSVGDPFFGTVTSDTVNGTVLENPRSFQFGLRFEF